MSSEVVSLIHKDSYIDSDFNRIVGMELKRLREEHNLSLEELANRIGNKVSRQTLSTYEFGRSKIKANIFIDICYALGHNPSEVFDEINLKYLKNAKLGG